MENMDILEKIENIVFTRQDVYVAAYSVEDNFRETQMRNLMEKLLSDGSIVRVARNKYCKKSTTSNMKQYEGIFSDEAIVLKENVEKEFPYIRFQIWELNWLNEFLNHLVAKNMIFLEVENDGCEFVYTALIEKYKGQMLLRPSEKEIDYYSTGGSIIVNRLVSEAPENKNNPHRPVIEKIMVDLFANKILRNSISMGDYPEMIESIFAKYEVDQVRLFRYARRRNKAKEIAEFIKTKTKVKLLVEV